MTEATRLLSLMADTARDQGTERYDHAQTMAAMRAKGPWNGMTNLLVFYKIQRQVPEGYKHLMDWVEWYEPTGNAVAKIFEAAMDAT